MMTTYVIAVGGSLIVPDHIDIEFLQRFRSIILNHVGKGDTFALIAGGGSTCREYQAAARDVEDLDEKDLDWLGIHATRLNAHLLRTIFRDVARRKLVTNPTKDIDFDGNQILVGSGWKPGHSTDYDAVLIADAIGADSVLNLSNINYVYDKDPAEHDDAEPVERLTWSQYREMIPDEWSPGLRSPFDPVASEEAQRLGLEVAIMGKDLDNLQYYLDDEPFDGTVIKQ